MDIAILVARILLGLIFLVFGLNGFLHFLPVPAKEGRAAQFLDALRGTGYIWMIYLLQVMGGAFLIAHFHPPIALLLLGPVVVNIVLFHLFLDPKGLIMAAVVGCLSAFLLWAYWASFAAIFY